MSINWRMILNARDPQSSGVSLIVIDIQNDFCHEKGAFSMYKHVDLSRIQKAVQSLLSFIDCWRGSNLPLIFIRTIHSEWTDSPSWLSRAGGKAKEMHICTPDKWGSDFYRIDPRDASCIVTKNRYSGFFETNLDLILRSRGVDTLLIAGVATNVCVESTARDAFNRNYSVIMLEDCCGAFDEEEHESAVKNISRYFGEVTTSGAILEHLEANLKFREET